MVRWCCVLLILTFRAQAVSEPLVVRTMLQDSAPKYVFMADGRVGGLGIDLMQALAHQDGNMRFEFAPLMTPFPRILFELEQGRIDVFIGAIYTDERAKNLHFLQPSLYQTTNRLVVRRQDAALAIDSLDDLRALGRDGMILVDRGTAHQQWLQQTGGLRLDAGADQRELNLQKLISGRARFYYSTDLGVLYTARQLGIESQIAVLPLVLKTEPQYLVVSVKADGRIAARLQAALQTLSDNGHLDAITAPYRFTPAQP